MTSDKYYQFNPSKSLTSKVINKAYQILDNSYSPFSKFKVAACMLDEFDNYHYGVNIENSSFSLTICAEAAAISHLITHGSKKIRSVWIICEDQEVVVSSCGACRQRIYEFAQNNSILIHSCNKTGVVATNSILELLYKPFKL